MNYSEVLTIVGAIFVANMGIILPMFLWIRSEANSDRKESAADRRDILQLIRKIQEEMTDFHGRLSTIEERHKNFEKKLG
jgi:hypothetical protein